MIKTDSNLSAQSLTGAARAVFAASQDKLKILYERWDPRDGAPVFTAAGKYTTRGWTDWTAGFHYGSGLLQFDATGDQAILQHAVDGIRAAMPDHLTAAGVHDHGFNTVSTYGNLLRLHREGRLQTTPVSEEVCRLALQVSGAVQARRWTALSGDTGFIHSFNGPHSLFIDTMRTLRVLASAHFHGQTLLAEQDRRIRLLDRLLSHAENTARWNLFWGHNRDIYDTPGRVAHEAIFNVVSGTFRCTNSQQGYSAFTTWTRGLAWAVCGFAEQLQFLSSLPEAEFQSAAVTNHRSKAAVLGRFLSAARVTADYFVRTTPTDGIPYWDTGAPGLRHIPDHQDRPADPFNEYEPVDSSAAAIAALGLLRLGAYLGEHDPDGRRYQATGLTVARTLFAEPYLSRQPDHEGLLLHTVYHRPQGWDHIPEGSRVPCGESALWGDYHLRELALLVTRMADGGTLPPIP